MGPASAPGQFGRDDREPRPEDMKRFVELAKNGETPGNCKSKGECEAYCHDQTNLEECVSFGVKAGFIKPDEAEKIRQTGGRGPGDCNSAESCRAYCSDQGHQEECFKFAEEHGFISKEEVDRTKEGFVRLRAGIENAPPEVAECVKSVLGSNIIKDIQSGSVTPGPEIGDRVRTCFERFGETGSHREMFNDAPPEVLSCLKEKLGDSFEAIRSGETSPSLDVADTFRGCFEKFKPQGFMMERPDDSSGQMPRPDMMPQQETFPYQPRPDQTGPTNSGFSQFSPAVIECLKTNLSEEQVSGLALGRQPTEEISQVLRKCFESVTLPPTQLNPNFVPLQQPAPNYIPPEGCTDRESCSRICLDSTNSYYASEMCVKFRSSIQSGNITNMLGMLLAPFLSFLVR
jgi:hypothetical protein